MSVDKHLRKERTEKSVEHAALPLSELKISDIDKKVQKISERPFKSSFKINTIKDVIIHPILKVPAYLFYEDDTYVSVSKCMVLEK